MLPGSFNCRGQIRAFTLTELAIVLGVMGTMLGGLWIAASMMQENKKISIAASEVVTIVHNVREAFYERGDFTDATATNIAPTLANAGVFPAEMMTPNSINPIDPWGGIVALWTDTAGAQTFRVSYYGLSKTGCADLASAIAARGTNMGMIQFLSWYDTPDPQHPGNITSAANYVSIPDGQALDPVDAANICNSNSVGPVSAEFDFSLK